MKGEKTPGREFDSVRDRDLEGCSRRKSLGERGCVLAP